ncbi:ornithine decarboxylase antizyme [Xylogone sp. PMI_703]|nr:ornithine decarboxylase antizyme [Xylogone sp. PMI_703]
MSPSRNQNHSSTSNRNGEAIARQANILASCYVVDSSARLTGFHYSTTGAGGTGFPEVLGASSGIPSPPSSPPLAAFTSANELALVSSRKRDVEGRRKSRKEGATYTIRGECERLFCETMKAVFLGEGRAAASGSVVMGASNNYNSNNNGSKHQRYRRNNIDAWLEMWDYVGGNSFRGFVGGDGSSKSLFAFFDSSVVGQDLKPSLMALIELAEAGFAVSQVVICLDRTIPETDRKTLLKSLRWVGFDLITLDTWAKDIDVTSKKWLFLGMEV